jgi:FMN phosphatase YigB (HAD superfamily)
MSPAIDAILFDMGGTLSYTTENDETNRNRLLIQLQELIGSQAPLAEFTALLVERGRAYRKWAKATMRELEEPRIWVEWMLPEFPSSQVAPQAARLNLLFLKAMRTRQFLPGAQETVLELFHRGYRLGMVSNTTSTREALEMWEEVEMTGFFETVLLSCIFGRRKPDPGMLVAAACQLGVAAERCAYVGDRPDRDVAAARQAGYGQAIIIHHATADPFLPQDALFPPDHLLTSPVQLLDLFPQRAATSERGQAGKEPALKPEQMVEE